MIPNAQKREVQSSGVTESGVFGISNKDAAHIMTILRDTLYSDKVLAILREYSANAWDAHREVGKNDLPIKVVLPTTMDPTLSIRDFGPGLSKEAVFEVYTQYGASTKRDSDKAVGMLGIGSKSGFAYSDSFTVTSWHGGMKRMFVAVLDASDKGVINLLHEEPCGDDETGVQIQIAIRPADIWEFQDKARKLYKHFYPRPDINIDLPDLPPDNMRLKHGRIFEQANDGWIAIMGCVPYRVNIDQIIDPTTKRDSGIGEYLTEISGELYFNIGEVQISASREELKYGDKTKAALIDKVNLLVEEFIKHTINALKLGSFTPWEKRLRAQVLNNLHLPIPKQYLDMTETSIHMDDPKTFTINVNKAITVNLMISSATRFVVRDDDRALAGYNLGSHDYLIRPLPDAKIEDVREELEKFIKKAKIDGIPVVDISTISWYPPLKYNKFNNNNNKKHHVKTFVLKTAFRSHGPWSNCWEIEKHKPSVSDVFVILNGFKAEGFNFYDQYKEDAELAKAFNFTMPTIYGYKTTSDKPVTPKDRLGMHYPEWRLKFIKDLTEDPAVKVLLEHWQWVNIFERSVYNRNSEKAHSKAVAALGDDHLVTFLFKLQADADKYLKTKALSKMAEVSKLNTRIEKGGKTEAQIAANAIQQRYQLLAVVGWSALWGDHSNEWYEYIKTVDALQLARAQRGMSWVQHQLTPSATSRSTSSGRVSRTPSKRALPTSRASGMRFSKKSGKKSRLISLSRKASTRGPKGSSRSQATP